MEWLERTGLERVKDGLVRAFLHQPSARALGILSRGFILLYRAQPAARRSEPQPCSEPRPSGSGERKQMTAGATEGGTRAISQSPPRDLWHYNGQYGSGHFPYFETRLAVKTHELGLSIDAFLERLMNESGESAARTPHPVSLSCLPGISSVDSATFTMMSVEPGVVDANI